MLFSRKKPEEIETYSRVRHDTATSFSKNQVEIEMSDGPKPPVSKIGAALQRKFMKQLEAIKQQKERDQMVLGLQSKTSTQEEDWGVKQDRVIGVTKTTRNHKANENFQEDTNDSSVNKLNNK